MLYTVGDVLHDDPGSKDPPLAQGSYGAQIYTNYAAALGERLSHDASKS